MRGGGGGCWACFRSGPISVGGSKRSAPLFPGPQEEPAHGLHPRFVVAEIWADRAGGGGGVRLSQCKLSQGVGDWGGGGAWLGCRHGVKPQLRAKEGNGWGLDCRHVLKMDPGLSRGTE